MVAHELDNKVVRPHQSTADSEDVVLSDVLSITTLFSAVSRRAFHEESTEEGKAEKIQKGEQLEPPAEGAEAADDDKDNEDEEEDAPVRLGDIWQGSVHQSTASEAEGEVELADLNVPWDSFSGLEYLGEGAMCRVFKGSLAGEMVAVKLPLEDGPESSENDLVVEMQILQHLHHENVIKLVAGGTASNGQHFIALELLAETLTERMGKIAIPSKMALATCISNGLQLASALAYLHDTALPGYTVMHRDLKPDNIAFTADDTLKLFDFGLAKVIKRKYRTKSAAYQMTGETGSLRYMAPEVCLCKPYNEKADTYSFAIIMHQMLSNRLPFEGLGHSGFVTNVMEGGERPKLSRDWPEDLKKLLTACWDPAIDLRPSMREVVSVLRSMEKEGVGKKRR